MCETCLKKLGNNHTYFYLDDLKIEVLYKYDGLFKSLLLQYKECYDEALKDVFLFDYLDILKIKYHGYKILYVPSSKKKINERGFKHLELIFKPLGLKEFTGLISKQELIQEGQSKENRHLMEDNFIYNGPYVDKVLIVDDVLTTGSSIKGVYNAIKGKCGKIKILVLSKK